MLVNCCYSYTHPFMRVYTVFYRENEQILDKERLFGEHMCVVQVFDHDTMISNICSITTKKGFLL